VRGGGSAANTAAWLAALAGTGQEYTCRATFAGCVGEDPVGAMLVAELRRGGVQTGDISVAVDADVVVMTTEVLRNIMYRVGDPDTGAPAWAPCWVRVGRVG